MAASQASRRAATPAAGPSGWAMMPPPAAKIRSVEPTRRVGAGRLPRRSGRTRTPASRCRACPRTAASGRPAPRRSTLSSDSQNLLREAVDVQVVGAGQPPDLLPGDVGPAEQRVARETAPAVAVARGSAAGVSGASSIMPTRPTRVEARHHAGAARLRTRSWRRRISSSSPVMLKANITFLPVRSAWSLTTRMHGARPARRTGSAGPSACSSSSLMKSIPASHERPDQRRRLLGREADARLDDGADQRPPLDAGEPARALDAELRAGIGVGERAGQARGRAAAARRTASARTGCRRPSASRLGSDGPILSSGQDSVTRARAPGRRPALRGSRPPAATARRRPRPRAPAPRPGPPARAFSSGVSPGTGDEGAARLLAGHRLGRRARVEGGLERGSRPRCGPDRSRQGLPRRPFAPTCPWRPVRQWGRPSPGP